MGSEMCIRDRVPPGVEFVRPDGLDISPLSEAAQYGSLSLVKLFVSLGCDVHIGAWWGANILVSAAGGGHCEVVRFLLETNPDLEKSPREASFALLMAARGGHLETVELLLELSLIHISEPTRRTPISYAVFCLKKKSMPSSA